MQERVGFTVSPRVNHYTGCFNAEVGLEPLEDKLKPNGWLEQFLAPADKDNVVVKLMKDAPMSRGTNLHGEFRVQVALRDEESMVENNRNWVIVTCIDGKPAYSVRPDKYESMLVGDGLFTGYQLVPNRDRYTLGYLYWQDSNGDLNHLVFRSPSGTIIASSLYRVAREEVQAGLDLQSQKPVSSIVLIHQG